MSKNTEWLVDLIGTIVTTLIFWAIFRFVAGAPGWAAIEGALIVGAVTSAASRVISVLGDEGD